LRKIIYGFIFTSLLLIAGIAYSQSNGESIYGPTAPNEHLWRIVIAVRPNPSVTIQQMMIAILKANPQAFNNGNVNGLKADYKLRIPPLAVIRQISPEYAVNAVTYQNNIWRKQQFARSRVVTTEAANFPKAKNKAIKHPHTHAKKQAVPHQETTNQTASLQTKSTAKTLAAPKVPKTTLTPPSSSLIEIEHQQNKPKPLVEAQQQSSANTEKQSQNTAEQQKNGIQTAQIATASSAKPVDVTGAKIQADVNSLTRETQNFRQGTESRLSAIEKQTKNIEAKINQLDEEFKTMTYHFIQIATKFTNQQKPVSYWQQLQESFKLRSTQLLTGALALLLLLLLYIKTRKSAKKAAIQRGQGKSLGEDTTQIKDEYDFMGSAEGTATKLDLARAYIDMGDYKSARDALSEVTRKGNDEQKKEAQDLLAKINVTNQQ
jgi:pilus assembly protein FimV